MRSHFIRGGAVALPLLAGVSCSDLPEQTALHAPDAGTRAAIVAGASVSSLVQVPASMRTAPFDQARSLTIPPGFTIAVLARVSRPRFLAIAPNGDILVSRPSVGVITLIRPRAGSDPAISTFASGLQNPHDMVFHTINGTTWLYVSEQNQIDRYLYTTGDTQAHGRQILISGLPDASLPELRGAYEHYLKNIALGPDHSLYVSIASSCNACASDTQSDPVRGAIYRYDAVGGNRHLFARGLRNAEGLAFVPGSNTLWAVVNNRDNIAFPFHDGTGRFGTVFQSYVDNHPPDEFTSVIDGANYGWPFCNPDPNTAAGMDDMPFDADALLNPYGSVSCASMTRIAKGIQAHSAPLGFVFLQGTNFPAPWQQGAVVALHGSWNRSTKTGYKVIHFAWSGSRPGTQSDLVTGWATASSQWGRPVDVAVDAQGALLISDDYSGTIYRLAPSATITSALVGRESQRCLDVYGASHASGTSVIIWDCHGSTNQQWTFPPVGVTGTVRVYGGSMCLDDEGARGLSGDSIIVWPCHGGPNQQWTRLSTGELRGINGKCVDAKGAATVDGTKVILWTCTGGSNQKWDPGS